METIFLTPIDKAEIICKENVEAFNILLNEIDRLESIISNYETIKSGETTYLETENVSFINEGNNTQVTEHQNQIEPEKVESGNNQEKVYFFSDTEGNVRIIGDLGYALELSEEKERIYEAICIGKKKSVLVSENS